MTESEGKMMMTLMDLRHSHQSVVPHSEFFTRGRLSIPSAMDSSRYLWYVTHDALNAH